MAEKNIRIGRVSSIDYGNGMISVTYPDLDDSVTDDLPVFSMGDEYKMPPVFTFQYVSINTKFQCTSLISYWSLHSNMFLLIHYRVPNLARKLYPLHFNMFLLILVTDI